MLANPCVSSIYSIKLKLNIYFSKGYMVLFPCLRTLLNFSGILDKSLEFSRMNFFRMWMLVTLLYCTHRHVHYVQGQTYEKEYLADVNIYAAMCPVYEFFVLRAHLQRRSEQVEQESQHSSHQLDMEHWSMKEIHQSNTTLMEQLLLLANQERY